MAQIIDPIRSLTDDQKIALRFSHYLSEYTVEFRTARKAFKARFGVSLGDCFSGDKASDEITAALVRAQRALAAIGIDLFGKRPLVGGNDPTRMDRMPAARVEQVNNLIIAAFNAE